jgi:hypothetical protein
MARCQTGVFMSVFCDASESIELLYDRECLRNNAVSLYFLEIPHFTLAKEPKVFKNNVWNIFSARPKLCILVVFKISHAPIYAMFL